MPVLGVSLKAEIYCVGVTPSRIIRKKSYLDGGLEEKNPEGEASNGCDRAGTRQEDNIRSSDIFGRTASKRGNASEKK